MLFMLPSGEGVEIDPAPRDQDLVDETIVRLKARGETVARIAAVINRDVRTVYRRLRELRRRAREMSLAPPASVVLFGPDPSWTPESEARILDPSCPKCGGPSGAIGPGSALYCAACTRTGHEARIAADLEAELSRLAAKEADDESRRRAETEERRLRRRRGRAEKRKQIPA